MFIRTIDWNSLTSYRSYFLGDTRAILTIMRDLDKLWNLFLVDGEKIVFCGPEFKDGCKTTYDLIITSFSYYAIEDFRFLNFTIKIISI